MAVSVRIELLKPCVRPSISMYHASSVYSRSIASGMARQHDTKAYSVFCRASSLSLAHGKAANRRVGRLADCASRSPRHGWRGRHNAGQRRRQPLVTQELRHRLRIHSLNRPSPHRQRDALQGFMHNVPTPCQPLPASPRQSANTAAQPAVGTEARSHHSPCDWRPCPSNRRLRTSASTFLCLVRHPAIRVPHALLLSRYLPSPTCLPSYIPTPSPSSCVFSSQASCAIYTLHIPTMPSAVKPPQTLYDKVFEDHIVEEKEDGTILLYIGMFCVAKPKSSGLTDLQTGILSTK